MNRISFTSGAVTKITPDHYNIELFNGDKTVYKGTLTCIAAANAISKHYPKITMA